MLHIIYGPDTFSAHEKLQEILSSCEVGTQDAGTVQWLEGKTATPVEIFEACEQSSMFADTKVVVVEGLLARFSKSDVRRRPAKAKKRGPKPADLGAWQDFARRAAQLPEKTVLILADADLKVPNTLLDDLRPIAAAVTMCPSLNPSDLVRWVQERVAQRGGVIEGPAASRLAALVGPDLWLLNSEIQKLVVYADGRPIQMSMVDDMAVAAVTPTIFMLVDAIVERNAQLARRRLDDMYHKGLIAGIVFTMVARQLRLIAQIHEARGRRGLQDPSGELAGLPPFSLQRATRQAQRLSEADTRRALQCVVDADRAVKSGVFSERMALEMLVTDIVS